MRSLGALLQHAQMLVRQKQRMALPAACQPSPLPPNTVMVPPSFLCQVEENKHASVAKESQRMLLQTMTECLQQQWDERVRVAVPPLVPPNACTD